jgi:hypothetical protein
MNFTLKQHFFMMIFPAISLALPDIFGLNIAVILA